MQKLLIILFIIIINSSAYSKTISGKAIVIDGDTIKINSSKIRLFGMPLKKNKNVKKYF